VVMSVAVRTPAGRTIGRGRGEGREDDREQDGVGYGVRASDRLSAVQLVRGKLARGPKKVIPVTVRRVPDHHRAITFTLSVSDFHHRHLCLPLLVLLPEPHSRRLHYLDPMLRFQCPALKVPLSGMFYPLQCRRPILPLFRQVEMG